MVFILCSVRHRQASPSVKSLNGGSTLGNPLATYFLQISNTTASLFQLVNYNSIFIGPSSSSLLAHAVRLGIYRIALYKRHEII